MAFGVGDNYIRLPISGGKTLAMKYVAPAVGDDYVLLPTSDGGTIAHKYTAPSVGDKCIILPTASGGTIALSVNALSEIPARMYHSTLCLPGTNDIYLIGGLGAAPLNDCWRSRNGGRSFVCMSNAVNDQTENGIINSATVALANGKILIASGYIYGGTPYAQMHISDDGGRAWTRFTPTDGPATSSVRSAMVQLSDGSILHLQPQTSGSDNGVVLSSEDEGETWTEICDTAPWSPVWDYADGGLSAVVTSYDDIVVFTDNHAYSSYRGLNTAFRSSDGGANWSEISPAFEYTDFDEDYMSNVSLTVDSDDNIYAMFEAEYIGGSGNLFWDVWKSEDAGANWDLISHFEDPVFSLYDNLTRTVDSLICDKSGRLAYIDWLGTGRRLLSEDGGEYWEQTWQQPEPAWPRGKLHGGIE